MALPTIQMEDGRRREALVGLIDHLIMADQHVSLLEFLGAVLVHFAVREGDPLFTLRGSSRYESLGACRDQCEVIFSMFVVRLSHDAEQARNLLSIATMELGFECRFNEAGGRGIQSVVDSFARLRNAAPHVRRKIMKGSGGDRGRRQTAYRA